jgi:hypothetical protein
MYDGFESFQYVISLCNLCLQPVGKLEVPVFRLCHHVTVVWNVMIGITVNLESDVASLHVFYKTFPLQ